MAARKRKAAAPSAVSHRFTVHPRYGGWTVLDTSTTAQPGGGFMKPLEVGHADTREEADAIVARLEAEQENT